MLKMSKISTKSKFSKISTFSRFWKHLKILKFRKFSPPKIVGARKNFIAAPPNTLNYVSGDLPKCQGHSARTYTAAQGRTVRVLFETIHDFRDFSWFFIDFARPPGVPGWISDEFWKFLAENHDLWPLVSSNTASSGPRLVWIIIIHP